MDENGKLGEMSKTTASVASGLLLAAGPSLATAEASGAFQGLEHSLVMYVIAGAATLIGGMFTALVWFLKREHAAITGDNKSTKEGIHAIKSGMSALALNLEELSGDVRTELAQRVKISDFSESMNRLHEKVNAHGKALAYVRAKMGLPIEDEG